MKDYTKYIVLIKNTEETLLFYFDSVGDAMIHASDLGYRFQDIKIIELQHFSGFRL